MKILISTLTFSKLNPIECINLISKNKFRLLETTPNFLKVNKKNYKHNDFKIFLIKKKN